MSVGRRTGVSIFRTGCRMTALGGAFSVTSGGGAATNGLLNNLIIYESGNELTGNLLDLHTNALHLTDVNTVTSNPGLVYPLARQYTRANSEYHTRPGDDALLSTGAVDFTLAAWARLDNKPGNMRLAARWDGGNTEYVVTYVLATDRFRMTLPAGFVEANSLGGPVVNTWYLIIVWHDDNANTISIQVNNGVVDSQGGIAAPADTAATFQLGAYNIPRVDFWNGRANPTMFWKSAAGAGGVLTAAQRTALYNAGAGLTYAAFTV